MNPETPASPREQRLEEELRAAQRALRTLQRERRQAECFALRSKQAILGINRELQSTVRDLERTLEELREAKSRADRASEAKGRFLATISHELRTPMNGILGTAELLAHAPLAPAELELVEILRRSGRGLLSIINDVLDFTKAESGRIELERTRFDLHAVLHAVVDMLLTPSRAKGVELALSIAPGLPRFVLGDPVRLRQVLLNLLDNALKFTREGSVHLDARRAGGARGRLFFAVTDTGIGIPESARATIFEPFVQADSSTTRRFGGSGLGLAICKHLVGLMGGELEFASEVSKGTCFHFEAALEDAPDQESALAETQIRSVAAVRLGLRVLVVDDNPVNRLVAQRMLEKLGCTVECAADGREAVARAGATCFDAILMDCSMPVLDGYAATAEIRRLPGAHARVRVLAMTAHALEGDREKCLAAGMDGYLQKPMRLRDLQAQLAPCVAGR